MFGKAVVRNMISRSAENATDRRLFMKAAGVAGMGAVGAGALGSLAASPAEAAPSDGAVLNFALNLEYLEAEFYSHAAFGHGLGSGLVGGTGRLGGVTGGHSVPFKSRKVRQIAREIAYDEVNHVEFLRTALGGARVSRPAIDLKYSFTAAARAAGLIGAHQSFNPFANENNFLLAAFIFEDVGVTAYKGAAPLISNKTYLEAAAGILAVEAYHAANIRTAIVTKGLELEQATVKISDARDSLDGSSDDDQGVLLDGKTNIVPADKNSIAFSRSAAQVLNVVYLTPKKATSGGFLPKGTNGEIHESGANG
jgi:hypothetical protein